MTLPSSKTAPLIYTENPLTESLRLQWQDQQQSILDVSNIPSDYGVKPIDSTQWAGISLSFIAVSRILVTIEGAELACGQSLLGIIMK